MEKVESELTFYICDNCNMMFCNGVHTSKKNAKGKYVGRNHFCSIFCKKERRLKRKNKTIKKETVDITYICEWCIDSDIPENNPGSCIISICEKHGKTWHYPQTTHFGKPKTGKSVA